MEQWPLCTLSSAAWGSPRRSYTTRRCYHLDLPGRLEEVDCRLYPRHDHRARAGLVLRPPAELGARSEYHNAVCHCSSDPIPRRRRSGAPILARLRLRPTRCIISDRHSKRATRCSDTSPRTIHITARNAERIAGSPLSGPRPFKATIVAVSYMRLLALRLERSLFPFAMRRNGVGVLLSCDQKLDSFASYFMMQVL